jgi:hypothetical protein
LHADCSESAQSYRALSNRRALPHKRASASIYETEAISGPKVFCFICQKISLASHIGRVLSLKHEPKYRVVPMTVADFEAILFAQGCTFGLPEPDPDTGERLSLARRELRHRVGLCFYPGRQHDPVSSDLLLRACTELELDPSLFGLG